MGDDLLLGGDVPVWTRREAPAPDEDDDESEIADLSFSAWSKRMTGTIWSAESDELKASLIACDADQPSSDHVNLDVDVLLVGVLGEGIVEVDGTINFMWPGTALLIPKGARRITRGTGGRFAYLSCRRPR